MVQFIHLGVAFGEVVALQGLLAPLLQGRLESIEAKLDAVALQLSALTASMGASHMPRSDKSDATPSITTTNTSPL